MKLHRSLVPSVVVFGVILLAVQISGSPVQVPSGTWQHVGSLSSARGGAAAALLEDGRVLVTGGETDNGPTAGVELFDVNTGTLVAAAPMHAARSHHSAVALHNGRVLVAGGRGLDGVTLDSAEMYDPATDSWMDVGPMGHPRARHTASLLDSGYVLITGGDNDGAATGSFEIFSPFSGGFSELGSLASPRTSHAATVMRGNKVLVVGGSNGTDVLASSEILDFANEAMFPGPSMTYAREGLTATTLLDGRVLVAGGHDGTTEVGAAEVFNDTAFTLVGSLGEPRWDHLATLLPHNNQVLIIGGTTGSNAGLTAELFRPWDGTFAATGWPTDRREGASGSALSVDGLFVVAGGRWTASAELYGFPTVKTDKDDYAPGETVTITGRGWQAEERVTLVLREDVDPPMHEDRVFEATADQNGNIVDNRFAPESHDIGVRFYLIAIGVESGLAAHATFTDAQEDYDHWADDSTSWINGALMGNNSNYFEGEVVPHYFKSEGLTIGQTYAFNIYYDYFDGAPPPNQCGFDSLTTYNVSRSPSFVDGIPSLDDATPEGGNFYTLGANITSATGPFTSTVQRYVTVVFTATAAKAQFYWGLRLALPNGVSGCLGAHEWPGASLQTNVATTPSVAGATMLGGGGTLQINPSGIIVGSITGFKWHDLDGDGVVDGGEPKLSGWTIRLCSDANCATVLQTTTTDGSGNYTFNVTPGTYYVGEVLQSGYQQTFPTGTGIHGPLTVNATTPTHTDKNFGNRQQGSITIIKDSVPDDGQDFAYTTTGGLTPSSFTLDDDGDAGNGTSNQQVFQNLTPGSYSVTETDPGSGWGVTVACVTSGAGTGTSTAGRTATITLGAGGSVTCTYTNTKAGTITIIKDSVPDDGQDFAYTTTGGLTPSSFMLDDDGETTNLSNTLVFSNVTPGGYSVTETDPGAGWGVTVACVTSGTGTSTSTAGRTATITLGAGGSVTCTYTNTKAGTITIIKDAVPDDPQDFGFTSTVPGFATFTLDDDPTSLTPINTQVMNNVTPGSYSVTETPIAGWNVTLQCQVSGTGASATTTNGTANITLGAGGSVNCTYTNTKVVEPCIDTKAPSVSVYSSSSSQVVLRVLDTGSGVQTIEVIVAKNVNVTVPPFAAGTTAPIYVTGTKINLGSSAQIGLRVTDRCGNVTVFDPVDATVSGGSRPEGVLLAPVYHDESLVQITNHGLTELSLTVNGHLIVVKNIGKDEVRTIDIGWALNAASDNNTVLVVPKGPKKSSAHVFIYPPPILVGQEESAPKKIRQVKTATIVQLP